jgi:hypothetical protein
LSISFYRNSTNQGHSHVPSSIAPPAASLPGCALLSPGRQVHHDYSQRPQTSVPNGSAPHPESLARGRLRPGSTPAVRHCALLRPHRGSSSGYLRRLKCRSSGHFGFWHHGHSLGDGTSIDFCPYHQKKHEISFVGAMTTTRGRVRIRSVLTFYHAGAMVSPWGRGADSSTAGAIASSAAAVLGSSPSQDKSVDFLHST